MKGKQRRRVSSLRRWLSYAQAQAYLERVKPEFAYPPVRLRLDPSARTSSISPGELRIAPHVYSSDPAWVSLFRHELGHFYRPYRVPGTLEYQARDVVYAAKLLEKANLPLAQGFIHHILNVAYDILDDFQSLQRFGTQEFSRRMEEKWDKTLREDPSLDPANTGDILFEILMDVSRSWCDLEVQKTVPAFPRAKPYTEEISKILSLPSSVEEKVQEVIKVLVKAIEDYRDEEAPPPLLFFFFMPGAGQKPSHAVIQALALALAQEGGEEDGEEGIERLLALSQNLLQALIGEGYEGEVGLKMDVATLRALARKKIVFRLPPSSRRGGFSMKVGNRVWSPEEEPEDLDLEASWEEGGGVLIPGVSTLAGIFKPSQMPPEVTGSAPIVLCVDTSGSMDEKSTILAIFSLIEAAREAKVPVGTVLFANRPYCIQPLTTDYDALEEEVVKRYGEGGQGNSCPGADKVEEVLGQEKAVVVFVTDWGFYDHDIETAHQALCRYQREGHRVVNIVMFTDRDAPKDPPYQAIFCPNIETLSSLLIDLTLEGGK